MKDLGVYKHVFKIDEFYMAAYIIYLLVLFITNKKITHVCLKLS